MPVQNSLSSTVRQDGSSEASDEAIAAAWKARVLVSSRRIFRST